MALTRLMELNWSIRINLKNSRAHNLSQAVFEPYVRIYPWEDGEVTDITNSLMTIETMRKDGNGERVKVVFDYNVIDTIVAELSPLEICQRSVEVIPEWMKPLAKMELRFSEEISYKDTFPANRVHVSIQFNHLSQVISILHRMPYVSSFNEDGITLDDFNQPPTTEVDLFDNKFGAFETFVVIRSLGTLAATMVNKGIIAPRGAIHDHLTKRNQGTPFAILKTDTGTSVYNIDTLELMKNVLTETFDN